MVQSVMQAYPQNPCKNLGAVAQTYNFTAERAETGVFLRLTG